MAGRYRTSRKGIGGRPPGVATTVVRLPLTVAVLARSLASGQIRAGDISAFLDHEQRSSASVPMASSRAACGFPYPADDYLDSPLDFNELLIINPAATFAVRLASESMTGAGLFPGDIAIVDRSVQPVSGCIVLALLEGEFTVKRYQRTAVGALLSAENPAFPNIAVNEEQAFEIWGVVTKSIRML